MNPIPWMQTACARARMPSSREQVELYRNDRLRKLLAYAYQHVPYYRRLFDRSGVKPADIRQISDLGKIPMSTKSDLRASAQDAVSDEVSPSKLRAKFTTGSTGEPFQIRRTFWESGVFNMILMRNFRDYGWRRTDTVAVISMHSRSSGRKGGMPSFISGVMNRVASNRVHLDCLADPEQLADQLEQIRPDVVLSYAGILARVGDILSERNQKTWQPRMLISGSETMTMLRRRQMEEGFGARAFDYYAAYESGLIAWECRSTGLYHVADDHNILELEQNGRAVPMKDGERGETIITNLHSFSMPFIRYRLNDAVVSGPARCPCGAPFSTLRGIEGRRIDYFIMPDGRYVHPLGISRTFIQEFPGIKQYQIVQETRDRIAVRIVHSPLHSPERLADIPRRVTEYLGFNLHVRVDLIDRMDPEPTGKYKLFISHVAGK